MRWSSTIEQGAAEAIYPPDHEALGDARFDATDRGLTQRALGAATGFVELDEDFGEARAAPLGSALYRLALNERRDEAFPLAQPNTRPGCNQGRARRSRCGSPLFAVMGP